MRKSILLLSLAGSFLIIISSFIHVSFIYAFVAFLLVGQIPGTHSFVTPDNRLLFISLISGFIASRLLGRYLHVPVPRFALKLLYRH